MSFMICFVLTLLKVDMAIHTNQTYADLSRYISHNSVVCTFWEEFTICCSTSSLVVWVHHCCSLQCFCKLLLLTVSMYVSSPLIPQQSCATVFLVRSITGHLAWNWGHLDWKYAPECIIQWYYALSVKCTPFVIHGKRLNYESFMAFRTAGLMCDIIQYVSVRLYVTILWIKSMPFSHTSNCRVTKKYCHSWLEQSSLDIPCEQQTI